MLYYLHRYRATVAYLLIIILLSKTFDIAARYDFIDNFFSPFSACVGLLFVFRNFAQCELGHWVIIPMLIAGIFSHYVSTMENATTFAFIAGELTDMVLFTYLRKPLLQRLFWAAIISSPVDSIVFLYMIDNLTLFTAFMLTIVKIIVVITMLMLWDFMRPLKISLRS